MERTYTSDFVKSKLEEWSEYKGYDVAAGSLQSKNAEIEYTPLCVNWSTHDSQRRFKYLLRPDSEFIYKVGK